MDIEELRKFQEEQEQKFQSNQKLELEIIRQKVRLQGEERAKDRLKKL